MKRITFVPGAVVSPAAITIPTDAPDIDAVVSAEIIRLPGAFAPAALVGADLAATQADHATAARHNVGASPVVATTPTKLTARTISLNVNTALGDLLRLSYQEVGVRVLVS
jgi:hypothetical protein